MRLFVHYFINMLIVVTMLQLMQTDKELQWILLGVFFILVYAYLENYKELFPEEK